MSTAAVAATTECLIPGLPDDIATSILLSLPLSHYRCLKPTCRSWHAFFSSPSLLLLRRLNRRCRRLLCVFPTDPSLSHPYLLDPSTLTWMALPRVPCSPYLYNLSNFVPAAVSGCLYLVGGSQFDARVYPLERPMPSRAVYRMDLAVVPLTWERMKDMQSARGSFACATVERPRTLGIASENKTSWASDGLNEDGIIVVAGGGSRHSMFPCVGSRSRVAEIFNLSTGKWREVEPLPKCRAGCVGWIMDGEEEEEFWVMGGYSGYRTMSGVFPMDVYCRDGAVFGLRSGKWRGIGDMWSDGERRKLGPVAVLHGENEDVQGIFMLDQDDIFRYNIASNTWMKEATLPRKNMEDESCGFVAMDGELHVLTSGSSGTAESLPSHARKRTKQKVTLDIQVYHPKKRKWRFLTTIAPFKHPLDFNVATFCTMHL